MMLNFLAIDVPNWIETGLRTLFYGLCSTLYRLVIGMYDIFELLCTVRILDMDVVDSLAQRIGLILGLVMLFIVIFSLINSLINPDLLTDKAKSPVNIIKKVILVIIMFGISSFAFNGLYYVQNVVIKSNVVVKLFVPAQVSTDNFGNLLTKEMFMSFYTINEELDGSSDDEVVYCEDVIDALGNNILSMGTFEMGKKCLDKTVKVGGEDVFIIDFSYFYSLIVAGFLVYFLFMYCLSVGVRTFQLVFLEIISPMAFVGYLSPKNDNMFSKWIKMYFSTYLDLFIRIGIISFVTFIITAILGNGTDYGNLVEVIAGTSGFTKILLEILLIFALLTFAKKAPDLLKVLFPGGDSKLGFGLSSPKKMFDSMLGGNLVRGGMIGAAGLGVGAAIGGVGNAVRGAINDKDNRLRGAFGGLFGGLTSGGLAGAKAKGIGKAFGASNKAALDQSRRIAEWRANGGNSPLGRWGAGLQHRLGITTRGEGDAREEQIYNDYIKLQDTIEGYAENNSVVKKLKRKYEQIQNAGRMKFYDANGNVIREETDDEFNTRIENARDDYKNAMKAVVTAGMSGSRAASYQDSNGQTVNITVEDGVSDSIKSSTEKLNRDISNTGLDKKGYTNVSNYDDMDRQTIKARADVVKLTSTEEFASHKADDKYSSSNKK